MRNRFYFYSDPGHAWMKVPRKLVEKLGVEVSSYSYQRGDDLYLEEDCDAGAFIKACRDKYGASWQPVFAERHTNKRSKIRSYDHYRK